MGMHIGSSPAGMVLKAFASDMMSVKFVRPVLDPFQKNRCGLLLGPLLPGLIGAAGIIVTVLFLKENPISTGFSFFNHVFYSITLPSSVYGDGKSIINSYCLVEWEDNDHERSGNETRCNCW